MTGDETSLQSGARSCGDVETALRRLARRALGFSGADIERLVREARQSARRQQRPISFADLDRLLASSRPVLSAEKRRRVAIHEAGHMLVRILLDVGALTVVTIDAATGGYTKSLFGDDHLDTVERCEHYLQATMAGRAAEQVIYGAALAGSGGSERSDLAKATQLATAMGVSLGFGRRRPLLYHHPDDWQAMVMRDPGIARRVHRRLDQAERRARKLIQRHLGTLIMMTAELVARGTLEGAELARLVARVRGQLPSLERAIR